MKNLKKVLFSLALVLGIVFSSVTPAYARGKIELVDDENPDEIENCSIEPEYPAYDGDEEEDQEEQKDENKKPGKENNKKNNKK